MEWIHLIINGHPVKVSFDENSIHIYDAFLIKDDLKQRGYRWNPQDKSWIISPQDVSTEVDVLKNNLQPVIREGEKDDPAAAGEFPESFSVGELRQKIDHLLKQTFFQQVWVRGVIASEIKNYQWASYFDLKDEGEGSDLFFRSEIRTSQLDRIQKKLKDTGIADRLEKDLPVFFKVGVSVSNRYSVDVRLTVTDILTEYTQSKLKSQLDITVETLRKEGLLERQKELTLPALIHRMVLITSEMGTSIRDIQAGLHPHGNRYDIVFFDTRMEGAQAVDQLIATLKYIEKNKDRLKADAVVIARGGGSEQSLAVFNDYRLCKKICRMSLPVLTAIGHEKDLSAAEICSHFSPVPSTPSGMGKFFMNRFETLQNKLFQNVDSLIRYHDRVLDLETEKIQLMVRNLPQRLRVNLRMVNDGLVSVMSRFKQSVTYLMKDHFREVVQSVRLLRTRIGMSVREAKGSMEMLMSRLDFSRLKQKNGQNLGDLENLSRRVHRQGLRINRISLERIQALQDVVAASQPEKILKKGFTMTFDEHDRIITSAGQFPKDAPASLKFWDGKIPIKRKEES